MGLQASSFSAGCAINRKRRRYKPCLTSPPSKVVIPTLRKRASSCAWRYSRACFLRQSQRSLQNLQQKLMASRHDLLTNTSCIFLVGRGGKRREARGETGKRPLRIRTQMKGKTHTAGRRWERTGGGVERRGTHGRRCGEVWPHGRRGGAARHARADGRSGWARTGGSAEAGGVYHGIICTARARDSSISEIACDMA